MHLEASEMSVGLQPVGGSAVSNGPRLVGAAAPMPTQCCSCTSSPHVVFSGQQHVFPPGASTLISQPFSVEEHARLPVIPGQRLEANSSQSMAMPRHPMSVQRMQSTNMVRLSRNDLPMTSSTMASPRVMVGPNASPILSDHAGMAKPTQSSQLQSSRVAGHAALAVPIHSPGQRSQMALCPEGPAKPFSSPVVFDHAPASGSLMRPAAVVPQSTTAISAASVSSGAASHPQRWSPATERRVIRERPMESRVIGERSMESRVVGERSITREELFRSGHLIVAGGSDASSLDITSSFMTHHVLPQSQLDDTIRVPMTNSLEREDPFLPGRWIESNQGFLTHSTMPAANLSGNDTEALFPEHALMHPAAAAALAADGSAPYEDTSEEFMPMAPGDFFSVFNTDGIVVDKDEDLAPHAESDFWQTFPKPSLPRAAAAPSKDDDHVAALDSTAFWRCWPDPSER